jgi:hypothetical protein
MELEFQTWKISNATFCSVNLSINRRTRKMLDVNEGNLQRHKPSLVVYEVLSPYL